MYNKLRKLNHYQQIAVMMITSQISMFFVGLVFYHVFLAQWIDSLQRLKLLPLGFVLGGVWYYSYTLSVKYVGRLFR